LVWWHVGLVACWFGGMLVWWHVEGAEVHALVACGGCLFGGMWRDWWHVEGVKGWWHVEGVKGWALWNPDSVKGRT